MQNRKKQIVTHAMNNRHFVLNAISLGEISIKCEPGFKLFTKGSGGGLHAKLAERDIEYCASCHDVEGADPVCMMCHTEKIGD
jgi:hypothetical protein